MKKILILMALSILLCQMPAFAQTVIKSEVDKTTLSIDETLLYKVIITSSENKLPLPQLPKFEGFKVISQAQSSTASFAGNEIKTILVYAFVLAPLEKGKLKIPPSTITVKEKAYSTDALEIEITQGKQNLKPQPKEKPSLPEKSIPESEEPQTIL
ncbi:MAG: BatD family protein [Candidatus Omnitrophica bacterium]|nr:BatD family protein [Candidatus Omnitrophota bacterium]MDD5237552.1 BatD family protein [Candidatus Omnitrophota bacterium]